VDPISPERDVRLRLVSGEGHRELVLEAVRNAGLSVWIATANLKELLVPNPHSAAARGRLAYHSVLDELDELCQRGVELRLLHASLPSRAFRTSFDRYPRLVAGGLELRLCPRVHMKLVIVDGELLYLGSANWTGAGLGAKAPTRRNFELGVVTSDAALLDEVQGFYDAIWRGRECGGCKRRDVCEAPLDS
jgi:phosphatidylserine/phosphatidylglycerophosphate/cardiolipin synthase-like enzyme